MATFSLPAWACCSLVPFLHTSFVFRCLRSQLTIQIGKDPQIISAYARGGDFQHELLGGDLLGAWPHVTTPAWCTEDCKFNVLNVLKTARDAQDSRFRQDLSQI